MCAAKSTNAFLSRRGERFVTEKCSVESMRYWLRDPFSTKACYPLGFGEILNERVS